MASSKGARVFGFVVLVACVGVLAGGGWYFFGRQLLQDDDVAGDDDSEEVEPGVDAGPHHAHKSGKHHAKGGPAKGGSVGHAASDAPGGKSYEAALAGNNEDVSIGGAKGAPDLTDAQLGGPLRNGGFLNACGAPDSMHVTVKVAVRGGRAVGVTVSTSPPNPQIASCVDHAVRGLTWPVNGKMDSFVTTY
jgi:hypothetical protein